MKTMKEVKAELKKSGESYVTESVIIMTKKAMLEDQKSWGDCMCGEGKGEGDVWECTCGASEDFTGYKFWVYLVGDEDLKTKVTGYDSLQEAYDTIVERYED